MVALVNATLVGVGREATLSVTLPFAAPVGGVTATVTSLNTNLLTVDHPARSPSRKVRRSDKYR